MNRNRGKPPALTREQILQIRALDAQGNYPQAASFWGRLHGLSAEHIRRIRRGEIYQWVTEGIEQHLAEDARDMQHAESSLAAAADASLEALLAKLGRGEASAVDEVDDAVTRAQRKVIPPYLLDPSEREPQTGGPEESGEEDDGKR